MTKQEKERYEEPEMLRDILHRALNGRRFRLECGHYATFGTNLGNNITIYNGKKFKIICSQCGY